MYPPCYSFETAVRECSSIARGSEGSTSTKFSSPYLDLALGTALPSNDGAGAVDCDSRRAVEPVRTIRGVCWTQLNRLHRLAVLSAPNEWSS